MRFGPDWMDFYGTVEMGRGFLDRVNIDEERK
jgi:hypothetical protein